MRVICGMHLFTVNQALMESVGGYMGNRIKIILVVLMFFANVAIWSFVFFDNNEERIDSTNDIISVAGTETEDVAEKETTTSEPETEAPVSVRIVMVGDLLWHGGVQNTGRMDDGTYNYDHIFVHILDDVRNSDVAVVNEEVIIGGSEIGIRDYPKFNCREEVSDAIANAGFDVVLHATNHTMDQGIKAINNCIDIWRQRHPEVVYLGIHDSEEDYSKVYIYEKDGFKIAMLNYTYGLNGIDIPEGYEYMVNLLDEEKIRKDLAYAEENADFTIVYPHWGTEYVYEPDSSQKRWAQLFADCGADLVIGTHPHVIEPVEWITGGGGNKTLVYYSLGNYISAQDKAPRMLGAMADVTIEKNNDGQVMIKEYGVIPLVTHMAFGSKNMSTYKLKDYTEQLASENAILRYDTSFSIKMLRDLCRQVFGDLCEQ